jgi:hypothetical protein
MNKKYKLQNSPDNLPIAVTIIGQAITIPFDPDNTDYQAYLAWLAEGNTPLPADEVTQ